MLPFLLPTLAALAPPPDLPGAVTTPSGLAYVDTAVGSGKQPTAGQRCTVHYTGWLWFGNRKGPRIDSSRDAGEPITFRLGRGQVIPGWEEGVATMREGGKRTLIVPPGLAYGAAGAGDGLIPPHATLCFELELVRVQ